MRIPRAQLRIFTPLESFPAGERRRWSNYVRNGGGLTREEHSEIEGSALRDLLADRTPAALPVALVRRQGDRFLLCPLQLDLRAAAALEAFRRTVPDTVADTFVPDNRVRAQLDDLVSGGATPQMLDEPWEVPLHWFLAFSPVERRVREPPEGRGVRVVYVTHAGQARERLERALTALKGTFGEIGDLVAGVAWLGGRLSEVEPSSLVELDYGSVAGLFDPAELRADTTCAELWQVVEALEAADETLAASRCDVIRERWSRSWALQHAN